MNRIHFRNVPSRMVHIMRGEHDEPARRDVRTDWRGIVIVREGDYYPHSHCGVILNDRFYEFAENFNPNKLCKKCSDIAERIESVQGSRKIA